MAFVPGKVLSPQCPYCYDGVIVKEHRSKIFICVKCRQKVLLKDE